jgi:2-amino-4-hydroxy-6-hydroxymethyldihydropteridine diphosphokinase
VEIDTHLTPEQLYDRIRAVETLMNKYEKVNKGPRTIDMDILLYGDQSCTTDMLTLPHPGICRRKFVLVPLLEIAPDAISPIDGRRYDQYLAELDDPSQIVEVYHG